MIKHKQFGEEKVNFSSCVLTEVYHEGKLRQALKAATWRQEQGSAAHWLALHNLLSLLSQTTQDHLLRGGPPYGGHIDH